MQILALLIIIAFALFIISLFKEDSKSILDEDQTKSLPVEEDTLQIKDDTFNYKEFYYLFFKTKCDILFRYENNYYKFLNYDEDPLYNILISKIKKPLQNINSYSRYTREIFCHKISTNYVEALTNNSNVGLIKKYSYCLLTFQDFDEYQTDFDENTLLEFYKIINHGFIVSDIEKEEFIQNLQMELDIQEDLELRNIILGIFEKYKQYNKEAEDLKKLVLPPITDYVSFKKVCAFLNIDYSFYKENSIELYVTSMLKEKENEN